MLQKIMKHRPVGEVVVGVDLLLVVSGKEDLVRSYCPEQKQT